MVGFLYGENSLWALKDDVDGTLIRLTLYSTQKKILFSMTEEEMNHQRDKDKLYALWRGNILISYTVLITVCGYNIFFQDKHTV